MTDLDCLPDSGANVAGALTEAARIWGDAVAVRDGAQELTYAELTSRCLRVASGLHALGLEPGDRVAVLQRNGLALVESIFGALVGGLVVVPINMRLHAREIAHIVQDSGAGAVIHGGEFNDVMAVVAGGQSPVPLQISLDPSGEEFAFADLAASRQTLTECVTPPGAGAAWLFYTSGTTGRPKGAIWTHKTIATMTRSLLGDLYRFEPDDVVLHLAPMTHGSGTFLLPTICCGATTAISTSPAFDPADVVRTIRELGATCIAFLVPTMIVKLLGELEDPRRALSGIRHICYGGSPMYVDDLKRAIDAFGAILGQIYGQGEAPMAISCLPANETAALARADDARIASAGRPFGGVELRIATADGADAAIGEPGEILVRGDIVMAGYWQDPERTAETLLDGWLHTGDVGRLDERGYLYLLDRSKDMIISGGNNIYAREVEEVILELPEVAEVAVIGVSDPYWGESVHAFVVPAAGRIADPEQIIQHCRGSLASYKKPKAVRIVDELPRTPTARSSSESSATALRATSTATRRCRTATSGDSQPSRALASRPEFRAKRNRGGRRREVRRDLRAGPGPDDRSFAKRSSRVAGPHDRGVAEDVLCHPWRARCCQVLGRRALVVGRRVAGSPSAVRLGRRLQSSIRSRRGGPECRAVPGGSIKTGGPSFHVRGGDQTHERARPGLHLAPLMVSASLVDVGRSCGTRLFVVDVVFCVAIRAVFNLAVRDGGPTSCRPKRRGPPGPCLRFRRSSVLRHQWRRSRHPRRQLAPPRCSSRPVGPPRCQTTTPR